MRRILFIFPQPRKAAGGLDKFNAVGDTVRDNDIGTIASGFGKISVKESGIDTSILIDTALIGWGIGTKFSDSTNAGTLKDTNNDIVKNSLTLAKDILNSRAHEENSQGQLGAQN
ncbi:hypothetical protein ACJ41O_009269 [Fusarium nematophilum]